MLDSASAPSQAQGSWSFADVATGHPADAEDIKTEKPGDLDASLKAPADQADVAKQRGAQTGQTGKNINPKVVTSLEQGLKFQEFMVDELCDVHNQDLDRLVDRLAEDSLSTCYSGIESAHCASMLTSRAITKRAGCEKIDVPILHMVEWQADSRAELLLLAERHNSCVFGDLESFFRPDLGNVLKELKALGIKLRVLCNDVTSYCRLIFLVVVPQFEEGLECSHCCFNWMHS